MEQPGGSYNRVPLVLQTIPKMADSHRESVELEFRLLLPGSNSAPDKPDAIMVRQLKTPYDEIADSFRRR